MGWRNARPHPGPLPQERGETRTVPGIFMPFGAVFASWGLTSAVTICTNALSAVPSELPDVEGTRPRRLFSELVHKPCRVAWRGPSSTYGHRANLVWLQVRGRLELRCRTESKRRPYRSANWENVQNRRQNCDSSEPSLQPSRSPGGPAPLRRPIAGG